MRNQPSPLRKGLLYPLLMDFRFSVLIMFLSSCGSYPPVQKESRLLKDSMSEMRFSIIFVIHGDGDYFYHDTNGNEYLADKEALAVAKRVGQKNPYAEVFIFHQRARQNFLFFFPIRDGEFFYYRNGKLIATEQYWRDQEKSNLNPEIELYQRFHSNNQPKKINIFVYCGHEIPEFGGIGYDESYPDRSFTVDDLANGLKKLISVSSKIDLLMLSTCFGGTPYTIGMLGLYTGTIIASPDNLHLSYFDFQRLESLELCLKDRDVPAFAKRFAQHSFDRLTKDIQTAVYISVYDIDSVQGFLHSVLRVYKNRLKGISKNII